MIHRDTGGFARIHQDIMRMHEDLQGLTSVDCIYEDVSSIFLWICIGIAKECRL